MQTKNEILKVARRSSNAFDSGSHDRKVVRVGTPRLKLFFKVKLPNFGITLLE